jgi:aldose 1-epimerase
LGPNLHHQKHLKGDNMNVAPWIALLILVFRGVALEAEVKKAEWGRNADRQQVEIYTLKSAQIEVRAMTYGARLVSIRTPDRAGQMSDVILGYDSLQEYLHDTTHVGGVVGRFGNRIGNGTFSIDGKNYHLPLNNGRNTLHGGPLGFDRLVWKGSEISNGVEFTLISKDGDMGFPGNLTAKVRYTLKGNSLRIDYFAWTDKATVLNLTNHAYFNLTGSARKSILNEVVILNADRYTPINADLIPTGEQASVDGGPLDFRHATPIGLRIEEPNEQLRLAGGYDHNFVLNGRDGKMKLAAEVRDPETGRTLKVMTTEPGVQFYSGNHLDGSFVGRGMTFVKHSGFCLETQHFPDSPNEPSFPTTVLRPGQKFHSTTTLTFTAQ